MNSTRRIAVALLLLLGLSCAPSETVGIVDVGNDPKRVLLVHGHRLTGDVAVRFRDGRLTIGDNEIELLRRERTRQFAVNELKVLEMSFALSGPLLVVFTRGTADQPPLQTVVSDERALRRIAEFERIEQFAKANPAGLPARTEDNELSEATWAEIAAVARDR
jgi:hypothetical protein